MLTTLKVDDPFFSITTEKIAIRVLTNIQEYQKKFDKKKASEEKYNLEKNYLSEN